MSLGSAFGVLVLLASYLIFGEWMSRRQSPKGIPWVGKPRHWFFPKTRAGWRGVISAKELVIEGYSKYSKNDKLFIIPSLMWGAETLVPKSMISALLAHPDEALSAAEYHNDWIQGDYTFADPCVARNRIHYDLIKRAIPRQLHTLTPEIMSEVKAGYDTFWGMDTEWKEVSLHKEMLQIVTRMATRVAVGQALCRNEGFLRSSAKHSQTIMSSAIIIRFFPDFLKPLFGRLVTLPNRYYFRQWGQYVFPIIEQRIADIQRKSKDPSYDYKEPNDFLQWQIHLSLTQSIARERNIDIIAARVNGINFASIHTNMMVIVSALLDLYSSPPEKGYVEAIREEIERARECSEGVYALEGDRSEDNVEKGKQLLMNIVIWYISPFQQLIVPISPQVVAPAGVDFAGIHFPFGAVIGAPAWPIMHDPEYFHNPSEYDPFRFSRPHEEFQASTRREEAATGSNGHAVSDKDQNAEKHQDRTGDPGAETLKNSSLLNTTETFLAWGHGKHACPGRFLAATTLRLLMAYAVIHYDVEPIPVRPENRWIGGSPVPPKGIMLRMRRRKEMM
ncbi:MAG: hypothetical protein M1839_003509 [Geoglossum umbratile]|nr:MAG: hypothetical protein M1839_003509 [Geoglossum umbratile]